MALPVPGRRCGRGQSLIDMEDDDEDTMDMDLILNHFRRVDVNHAEAAEANGTDDNAEPELVQEPALENPEIANMNGTGQDSPMADALSNSSEDEVRALSPEPESDLEVLSPEVSEVFQPEVCSTPFLAQKKVCLKLKRSRAEIFMDTIVAWYEELSEKNRHCLTRKKLRRRAVQIAASINLELDKVPKNWLLVLESQHGLHVFKRLGKKSGARAIKAEPFLDEDNMDAANSEPIPKSVVDMKDVKIKKEHEVKFTQSGRFIHAPNFLVLTKKGFHCQVKSTELIDLTHDLYNGAPGQGGKLPPPKKPKIIDKTELPPPEWWVQEYKKNKLIPPRELVAFPVSPEEVVVFYDYDLPQDYYTTFGRDLDDNVSCTTPEEECPRGAQQVKFAHDANRPEFWPSFTL